MYALFFEKFKPNFQHTHTLGVRLCVSNGRHTHANISLELNNRVADSKLLYILNSCSFSYSLHILLFSPYILIHMYMKLSSPGQQWSTEFECWIENQQQKLLYCCMSPLYMYNITSESESVRENMCVPMHGVCIYKHTYIFLFILLYTYIIYIFKIEAKLYGFHE